MDILLIITLWIAFLTLIMTTLKIDFAERWRHLINFHLSLIIGVWINGLFNPQYKIWTYQQFTLKNIKSFDFIDNFSFLVIVYSIIFSLLFYWVINKILSVSQKKILKIFERLLLQKKVTYNFHVKTILTINKLKRIDADGVMSNDEIYESKKNEKEKTQYLIHSTTYKILILINATICLLIFEFPYKYIYVILMILFILTLIFGIPFLKALINKSDKSKEKIKNKSC